jgi:F0F1-type ATP synthase assembly protein I
MPPDRPSPITRYARGGAIAFEFSGTIGGGALCGWFLDSKLGTAPWLLLTLTVAAAIGGFFRLVKLVERFNEMDRERER